MNSHLKTRRTRPNAAQPAPRPLADDSGDVPLTGEDLIADLDPGWLTWSEERAGR